jgi:hypothetical protein
MVKKTTLACLAAALAVPFSAYPADQPAIPAEAKGPKSIPEFVAYAVEVTSLAIADSCTTRFPTLKPTFTTALAEYRKRAALAVSEMLQTERYKSLTGVTVPQDLVDTYADSAAMIRRGGGSITQQECAQVLSDIDSATGDKLQGVISQVLTSTKGIIEMRKSQGVK